jgi:hypothetical protein
VQLALVLDVKADRRLILAKHAGVHGEDELFALRLQCLGERGQRSIRLVVRSAEEQADIVTPRIERADGEFGAVEILRRARRLSDSTRREEPKGKKHAKSRKMSAHGVLSPSSELRRYC